MTDLTSPFSGIIRVEGDRSIAGQNIGAATTGDHSPIIKLEPDTLKAPHQVKLVGRMTNLPQAPAAVFVGRDDALAVMTETLTATSVQMAIGQVIHGMGGVGKSELARQYVTRHSQRYRLVWWITATSDEEIQADLASLAERVHPPLLEALALSTALGVEQAAYWALSWLQAHDDWLLVLDNVEDPKHVRKLLAQLRNGHIVITTRRQVAWPAEVTRLPLHLLAKDAATELIALTSERAIDPRERSAFEAIAAELGYLPLALEQAGSYIRESQISPSEYLSLLTAHAAHMYAASSEGGAAERTIARLWRIHLDAISERNTYAVHLLRVLACYASDNIPREILGTDEHRPMVLDALRLLASYSLITLDEKIVSVHRLIQAVVAAEDETRSTLREDSAPELALSWLAAAWIVTMEMPSRDSVAHQRALSPHIESLTRHHAITTNFHDHNHLFALAAHHELDQGNYRRAHALATYAIAVTTAVLDPEHSFTLKIRSNLASALRRLGRFIEAEKEYREIWQIQIRDLGEDHPDTLTSRSNLALVLGRSGQLREAEKEHRAIWQARIKTLGEEHPETLMNRINLASTLRSLGRFKEAEKHARAVCQAQIRVLGKNHPNTLISRSNLVDVLRDLGQLEEAEKQARAIFRTEVQVFGKDHPRTLISRSSLAVLQWELGRLEEPEKEHRAIWQTRVRVLGEDHFETLSSRNNLAVILCSLGRIEEAETEARSVWQALKRVLGQNHPDTLSSHSNLSFLLWRLGRLKEAKAEARVVWLAQVQVLGKNHPNTLMTRSFLDYLRHARKK
ncbi:FxSxx-COOH system tetratricopeptide repeat protein [Streptosporangium roseum]|uniref:FxSxx-COOH system tetratricopeptide repeat protein n=1 Tax=Streptosporangium roseum TaxID=2001 RepID=UPI0033237E08